MSFSSGNILRDKFAPGGSSPNAVLWGYMNSMLNAVNAANVGVGYDSIYSFSAALDSRSGYQDYLVLAADPSYMAVPEPDVPALLGLCGVLLLMRRRR